MLDVGPRTVARLATALVVIAGVRAAPLSNDDAALVRRALQSGQGAMKLHEVALQRFGNKTIPRFVTEAEVETTDGCTFLTRKGYRDGPKYIVSKQAINTGLDALALSNLAYIFEGKKNDTTGTADRITEKSESQNDIWAHPGGFGYFGILDGNLPVIAYSGTDFTNPPDVKADADSLKSKNYDFGGGLILDAGKGFLNQFNATLPYIEQAVINADLSKYGNMLLITGHSLGGAIANVAAVYFANKYKARVMLRTFGSPRVFSTSDSVSGSDLNSLFEIQTRLIEDSDTWGSTPPTNQGKIVTQRFVNYADPIPSLAACKTGWMHIGLGALDIYQPACYWNCKTPKTYVYGPQHLDYTPWQNGNVKRHTLVSYEERMKMALA